MDRLIRTTNISALVRIETIERSARITHHNML